MKTKSLLNLLQTGGTGYCDPCYSYVENDSYPEFFVEGFNSTVEEMQSVVGHLSYEDPYMGDEWFNDAIGIGSSEGADGDEGQSDWQHKTPSKIYYLYTDTTKCGRYMKVLKLDHQLVLMVLRMKLVTQMQMT